MGNAPDGKQAKDWMNDWTIFYWGWWIAWSPFVGMFIAKISRGNAIFTPESRSIYHIIFNGFKTEAGFLHLLIINIVMILVDGDSQVCFIFERLGYIVKLNLF